MREMANVRLWVMIIVAPFAYCDHKKIIRGNIKAVNVLVSSVSIAQKSLQPVTTKVISRVKFPVHFSTNTNFSNLVMSSHQPNDVTYLADSEELQTSKESHQIFSNKSR